MEFPTNNCGCNLKATKRINKTAAKLDIRFKKSTTIQVWSINKFLAICVIIIQIMPLILQTNIIADAAPTLQLASSIALTSSAIDKSELIGSVFGESLPKLRVRKHSHHHNHNHNSVDWENPCNGEYKRNNNTHLSREMILRDLRRALRQQRSFIINKNTNAINVTGIQEWFSHNQTYKFLAQVKPQAHINLIRWHRNMQIYVASMSYFKRKQRLISQRKSTISNSDISRELEELFHSTRGTLCLIEAAINKTNQNDKIHTIPRLQMQKHLRFRTKNNNQHDYEIDELDFIDLQFIKVRYFEIMLGMNKSLTRYLRESKCNKTNLSINLSSSLSSEYNSLMNSNSLYNSRSNSGSNESNEKINRMCKRIRQRRKYEHRNRSKRINSRQQNSSASN